MQWAWLPDNDTTTRDIWHVQRVGIENSATYSLDQSRGLYLFRGSAGISGRITIPGYSPSLFQEDQLYARTANGLWKIRWKAWLKTGLFRQTHESVFVNMRQLPTLVIDALEWKWYQFAFADGHVEQVPISRIFYSNLREEYRQEEGPSVTIKFRRGRTTPHRKTRKTTELPALSSTSSPSVDVSRSDFVQQAHKEPASAADHS